MKYETPKNANLILKGNGKDVGDLAVFAHPSAVGGMCFISMWQPSEKERLAIMAGLPVQVHVFTTGAPPAIAVNVSQEVDAIADGVE